MRQKAIPEGQPQGCPFFFVCSRGEWVNNMFVFV